MEVPRFLPGFSEVPAPASEPHQQHPSDPWVSAADRGSLFKVHLVAGKAHYLPPAWPPKAPCVSQEEAPSKPGSARYCGPHKGPPAHQKSSASGSQGPRAGNSGVTFLSPQEGAVFTWDGCSFRGHLEALDKASKTWIKSSPGLGHVGTSCKLSSWVTYSC